jgi:hypothetical protein
MRFSLLAALLLTLACAKNTGSVHGAAEYPSDVKLQANSLALTLADPRRQEDIPDGRYRLALSGDFEQEASQRLQGILSKNGLDLQVTVNVVRADHEGIDTQQGRKVRIDVGLKFALIGPDKTVIKNGRGNSWAEIPEEQATPEEIAKVLRETALNAFDQYWADAETLERINENIATYRDRRGF